jgi:predicted CxxxxCH...CXXCH cytochrome family protein
MVRCSLILGCFVAGIALISGCLPEYVVNMGDSGADAAIGPDGGAAVRHHPFGFAAPGMHGPEMTLQRQPCRACHGDDLAGGSSGVSCDGCHTPADPPAWRTRCTFCHGGGTDQTGAPPRHLGGTSDPAAAKFPPHAAHVSSTITTAIDCRQCHVKAVDVLSPDHAFDSTPGVAETDFGGGLSKQGTHDAQGTCASLYCHGNGRGDNGTVSSAAGPRTCASCHAGPASGQTEWVKMSGMHASHLGSVTGGVTGCADCHNSVTTTGTSIADPSKHVDGLRQVAFSVAGMTFDPAKQTCTGTCHSFAHSATAWQGSSARFHPIGYSAPTQHGPEMELQRLDCRGCHGSTLAGGGGGQPSCDSCHKPNWRTTCVYCHGGGVNQTGAPPRDLAAAQAAVSQSFRAHTVHVTQRIAAGFTCVQCHTNPADVLTTGHAFDATPRAAEVTLAAGLSPAGTYNGNGGCANLYCHGTGRVNGAIIDGAAPLTCAGCHPAMNSTSTLWGTMSGEHRRHLGLTGVTCGDCHRTVTLNGLTVIAPALHVNGKREISFSAAGFTYNPATRTCTGTCHGDNHNEQW